MRIVYESDVNDLAVADQLSVVIMSVVDLTSLRERACVSVVIKRRHVTSNFLVVVYVHNYGY